MEDDFETIEIENELKALAEEAELAEESKQSKNKKKDGNDLSLPDLSDEKDEKKPVPEQKPNSDKELSDFFHDYKPTNIKPKKNPIGIDFYPEKAEKKYHIVEKMISLGVLETEKEICDLIIKTKKSQNRDYDTWESKKELIDEQIDIITSTIKDGIWDFEIYKKKIKNQYSWENKLLISLEKDSSLNEQQKNIIKERINARKKIIEEELKKNPEEETDDVTPSPEEEKEKNKSSPQQKSLAPPKSIPSNIQTQKGEIIDFFPEKAENKYHDVEKMVSLGVLEKEKEMCDKIMDRKKNKNEDYETWKIKKESIDVKTETITSKIENGILDFETYKNNIKEQYLWENKLLFFLEKDPNLNEQQKKVVKERIYNRKKVIEEELKANPEEEAKEEEKQQKLVEKKNLDTFYDVPKEKEDEEIKLLT